MLNRIQADNYKSLLGFDFRPPQLSVLVGENGSGKTSIGGLLQAIRGLVVDARPVHDCFPAASLCRWHGKFCQRFGLSFSTHTGDLSYELEVLFDSHTLQPQIQLERIRHDGLIVYEFSGSLVRLGDMTFNFGSQSSFLAHVDVQTARAVLFGFPELLARVSVLRPDPARIGARSEHADRRLTPDCSNFSSWLRWFLQNKPDRIAEYFQSLTGPLPSIRALRAEEAGREVTEVSALFETAELGKLRFSLDELSEGQRQLLLLYLLLVDLEPGDVLFIDEPDNFISMREVQPWLSELDRALAGVGAQAILVSHGSEAMDYLGSRAAFHVTRPASGATRLVAYDGSDGAKPSDLVLYGPSEGPQASK